VQVSLSGPPASSFSEDSTHSSRSIARRGTHIRPFRVEQNGRLVVVAVGAQRLAERLVVVRMVLGADEGLPCGHLVPYG